MEITIKNHGVKGTDTITIFVRDGNGPQGNWATLEGGESTTILWDENSDTRYEVVPWKRIKPK
jgi:uncharacterized cupredoxin-like copper-binding protein